MIFGYVEIHAICASLCKFCARWFATFGQICASLFMLFMFVHVCATFVQFFVQLLCNFCAYSKCCASLCKFCASFLQYVNFFVFFLFLMIFNDFFESCEKVAENSWKSRGKDARGISEDEERCRQLFLKSNRHILGKCCACFMQVFSKGDFLHVVCKFVHVLCKNGKNVASMVSACFYQNDGGFRIFKKLK